MADLPDFDAQWDFSDPEGTEALFRELLEQHKDAPTDWRLELRTQIARALGLQREFEAAHEELDTVESRMGGRELTRVRYLLERGRVHNSAGEPEEARPMFEEAFELADEAGDDQLAVDAAHMVAIAVSGVSGEEEQTALEWNRKALEVAENSRAAAARQWQGSLYNNIGWNLHELERDQEALETFEKGVEWQRENGDAESLRVARWTVGRTLRSLGRVEEALEVQQAIVEEFGEGDPHVAQELGECLVALDRAEEAREHFETAYEGLKDDPWVQENHPEKLDRLERLAQEG